MQKKKNYIPVPCSFVDHVEILAMRKDPVHIKYLNNRSKKSFIQDKIKTWKTEEKQEFLITVSGTKIRLDKIIMLNDIPGPASIIKDKI